jgi:hypothetical protein
MFNLTSFESSQGTESGPLGTAISHIRYWLTKLVHSPETGVVKLTVNPFTPDVLYGEVVGLTSASNECELVDNRGAEAVAISLSRTTLQDGDQGYFRMTGVAEVKLVAGLDLHNGNILYAPSAEPGKATNVLPITPHRRVGVVADTAKYTQADGYLAKTILEFDDGVLVGP